MREIRTKPILIFVIILVALYGVIYVIPKVTDVLRSSYTVEYGELLTSDQTEGYIVKKETVYYADSSGKVNRYIKEGKLIRKGTRIMEVTETKKTKSDEQKQQDREREIVVKEGEVLTKTYQAQSEGIVTYNKDDMETELTPANMRDKSRFFYKRLSNGGNHSLKKNKVTRGDAVFKIVDRSGWFLVCYIPKKHAERYQRGTKVTIYIGEGDENQIMGTVRYVDPKTTNCRLVIRTDYYYPGFLTERVVDMHVVTSDVMGLLIENSSITEKNGKSGVYVKQKTGRYKFTPINVIATDGERSAITQSYFFDADGNTVNTVKNYDEVLRKP